MLRHTPREQRASAEGLPLLQQVVHSQHRRKEPPTLDHPQEWRSHRRQEAYRTRTNGSEAQAVVEHRTEKTLLQQMTQQQILAVAFQIRQMCGARCWTRDLR